MKTYYLDHAATTPLDKRVLDEMLPFMTSSFGNPSSIHHEGVLVKKKINESRKIVADYFGVDMSSVIFTSGGTEATNLAILGCAKSHLDQKEIITSTIEHHATMHTLDELEKQGYVIHRIPVNHEGFIDLDILKSKLSDKTLMVTLIWANNEIGTIQDVHKIGNMCHEHGVILHVDAVQMVPHFPIHLNHMPVDMMTVSAHKFYGPKGIGALIMKDKRLITPIVYGGNQEMGFRSGTENVYGIIGFAKALSLLCIEREERTHMSRLMGDQLVEKLKQRIPHIKQNGPKHQKDRLPGLLSLSFPNVSSTDLAYQLDELGFYVSTGSACLSNDIVMSHVLKAVGVSEKVGTIRISLGSSVSLDDLDSIVDGIVKAYQEISL